MADADVATSSGIQDGTEQMALEHGQTVTSCALVVEEFCHHQNSCGYNFSLALDEHITISLSIR